MPRCALAGGTEPLAEILRAEFAEEGGPATVIGGSQRASAKTAALINGAAGHALDFDDLVNQKFDALANPVIGARATRLRDLVSDLQTLPDLDEICALARTT